MPPSEVYVNVPERERYNEAVRRNLGIVKDALDEVNEAHPRTRYPLVRRLWWWVFGEPEAVTRTRFHENALRANSYLAALRARRPL